MHALGLLGFEAVVGVVVVTIIITIGVKGRPREVCVATLVMSANLLRS